MNANEAKQLADQFKDSQEVNKHLAKCLSEVEKAAKRGEYSVSVIMPEGTLGQVVTRKLIELGYKTKTQHDISSREYWSTLSWS